MWVTCGPKWCPAHLDPEKMPSESCDIIFWPPKKASTKINFEATTEEFWRAIDVSFKFFLKMANFLNVTVTHAWNSTLFLYVMVNEILSNCCYVYPCIVPTSLDVYVSKFQCLEAIQRWRIYDDEYMKRNQKWNSQFESALKRVHFPVYCSSFTLQL